MKQINHLAKVVSVSTSSLKLEISRHSACHNCEAQNGCSIRECQNRIINVPTIRAKQFSIGEEVVVSISQNSGYWALFFCYVLPLIIMLISLFTTYHLTQNEIKSGISAIIILIPYYFGLFLSNKYIAPKFQIRVSKTTD